MSTMIRLFFTVIAFLGILVAAVVGWPFIWGLMLWQFAEDEYLDEPIVYLGVIITALGLGVGGTTLWILYLGNLIGSVL